MNAAIDQNREKTLIGVDSIGFNVPTTAAVDATTHELLVKASTTTSGTQDTNLKQVGGATFALGQQVASASLPVVLTSSQLSTLTPLSSVTVNTISGFALETGGNLATIAGAVGSSKMNVNISSGSIANTSFIATQSTASNLKVAATLDAETSKVIGTVNQGTSPWVISGAITGTVTANISGSISNTTFAATQGTASNLKTEAHLYDSSTNGIGSTSNALDINIKSGSIANTSFAVTQGTAANLKATVDFSGTGLGSVQFWNGSAGCNNQVTNAGTFATQETAATTIYNGKKVVTTAGTRVTLASSQAVKSVTIKALAANTGIIYVGDTAVASTNGFALLAGDSLSLDIGNLATVNLDSSVNGEGVTYIGIN
jgi:hypothetical protein